MAKTKKTNKTRSTSTKSFQFTDLKQIFSYENESVLYSLIPLYAYSFSTFSVFHQKVDQLYNRKQQALYLLRKESMFKDFYLFRQLSLREQGYAYKILALLEEDVRNQNGENTYQLFQIAKAKLYMICDKMKNLPILDLNELDLLIEKEEKHTWRKPSFLNIMDRERHYAEDDPWTVCNYADVEKGTLILFLAKCYGIPLDYSDRLLRFEFYLNAEMFHLDYVPPTSIPLMNPKITKEDLDVFFEEPKKVYNYSLNEVTLTFSDMMNLLGFLSKRLNYRIPKIEFPFNKKEAQVELKEFLELSVYDPKNKDSYLESVIFVYIGFLFKRLMEEQIQMKHYFYDEQNDDGKLEIATLKDKNSFLHQEIEKQKDIISQLEKELQTIHKKYSQDIHEIQSQTHLVKYDFEQVLHENTEIKEELFYLRELLYDFSTEKTEEYVDDVTSEQMNECLSFLSEKKLIFIGGHPNWIKALKDYLPNVIVWDSHTRISETSLKNADLVSYLSEHMSHGLLRLVHPLVKKHYIPFVLVRSGNVMNEIKTIYDKLK